MLRPDCICVCSFSMTSPSWMMSCLRLMPVISENALASVLDSYTCVSMLSDTTLIVCPRKGAAASRNHFISASCCSRVRVLGWNSSSTHFSAAFSRAARSTCCGCAVAAGLSPSAGFDSFLQPATGTASAKANVHKVFFNGLPPARNEDEEQQRQSGGHPDGRIRQAHPGEVHE